MAKHVAVVLAAGGSARLGTAKQLLRRHGETLIHRVAMLAAATGAVRVIVVLGADHERIAEELMDVPHTPVLNPDWRTGLAGSLRAAAPWVPADHAALIVACDQPALEAGHLRALLDGARTASAWCAATDLGNIPGIPAVVPGVWFGDLDGAGDHGFRDRLRSLSGMSMFRLQAPELAKDVDTPDELRELIRAGLLDPS